MQHSGRIINIQKVIGGTDELLHVLDDAAVIFNTDFETLPGEFHDVIKGYQHVLLFANLEQPTGAVVSAGGSIKYHAGEIAHQQQRLNAAGQFEWGDRAQLFAYDVVGTDEL